MDKINTLEPIIKSNTGYFVFKLFAANAGNEPIFITGNFNGWQTALDQYEMVNKGNGHYEIALPLTTFQWDRIFYKYTRGSWDSEELDEFGGVHPNRMVFVTKGNTTDVVKFWKSNSRGYNPKFLPKIKVIHEHFEIPQLIKTRRIAALLPHDYYETETHYPVLYLQDGQNLFDIHAPFGSWEVDKKLAILTERGMGNIIIISIDHAREERLSEYTPTGRTRLGSGDGLKYAKFLSETLKPYIDAHFRTKPERQFTGIGGSSMGGLISIYASLLHPEVYSRLLIFSPSLWVSPGMANQFLRQLPQFDGRMYLYGGGREGSGMVPRLEEFDKLVKKHWANSLDVNLVIDPEGLHTESHWGREFPKAIAWLFFS